MSIVMVVHDHAEALEQHLPLFLQIAAEADSEVIVVDDMSMDETPEILKRFQSTYPNLYSTYFPWSVWNSNRFQLALNIGIKAACSNRIIFADIKCPPPCAEWLTGMSDGVVTMVYSGQKKKSVWLYQQTFDTIEDAIPYVRKKERRGAHDHEGSFLRLHQGHYDAVAVSVPQAFELIKHFGLPLSQFDFLFIHLRILFKNMFLKPITLNPEPHEDSALL